MPSPSLVVLCAVFMSSFTLHPESLTVDEGSSALLFCVHSGSVPPATITWTQNNNDIMTSSRISIMSSVLGHMDPPQVSSTLVLNPVELGDAGDYSCVARNDLISGSDIASEAGTLSVRGKLYVSVT